MLRFHLPGLAIAMVFFFLGEADAAPAASPATDADPLQELSSALSAFRGLGRTDITRYRVPVRLATDENSAGTKLEEIWRAPSDLVLRSANSSTPGAVVRSLAIYLEPLYVARTAILNLEWSEVAEEVRAAGTVRSRAESGGETITIELPDSSRTRLPQALRDVSRVKAGLDSHGRLRDLEVVLASREVIRVSCDYASRDARQPAQARWTLPSGEVVQVRTKFRRKSGLLLPSERQVTFPSRFDPKQTEEILIEYGTYEIDPVIPDSIWTARGSFRFDGNGLVN